MSTEMCTQCGMPRSDHQPIAQFCPVGHWDFSKTDTFAAPAPEVQGTPAKTGSEVQQNIAGGKHLHWRDVVGDNRSFLGDIGDCPLCPVGTPQKETPTMPYGAGAQNFGAVPEGVQGKEPQTPPDFPLWERACDCCRIDGAPVLTDSGKWIHCYDDDQANEPCVAGSVFALGEAAGRRSAITELKEWAETRKPILGDNSPADSKLRAEIYDAVITKCAELQEKTK